MRFHRPMGQAPAFYGGKVPLNNTLNKPHVKVICSISKSNKTDNNDLLIVINNPILRLIFIAVRKFVLVALLI